MSYLRRFLPMIVILFAAGAAQAQLPKVDIKDSRNNPVIVKAFRSVVAKPSESAVRVIADDREVAFGAIVEADGWIVTKWDEIRDKKNLKVRLKDGRELDAKLFGVHTEFDLAALKVDAKGLKPVEWRPSKDARVGRWVASVGVDADPVAIGVVSVGTRPLKIGDQPPKNVNINSGYLGVGLEPGMGGARITTVEPKSPGDKAGIKVNDIIYEAAGKKIVDHEALINTIGRLRAGDKVLLKIRRGEDELELNATLGKRSGKALGNPQELMGSELSNRRGGFPFILQHDTVLKPKDCGGPLVDLDGKTVGINIARAGRTETYAIPAEHVQGILTQLKSGAILPLAADVVLRVASTLSNKDPISKLGKDKFMKVYDVKLKGGSTYTIEMDSGELDSYLILEDAKGKKVAEDDDGGGFPNAKIVFQAPSDGEYRILATTFNASGSGNFTLTVKKQNDAK